MIPFDLFSRFECGDMTVLFFKKDAALAFTIIPTGMEEQIPEHPSDITQTTACRGICLANKSTMSSVTLENMVQCHVQGDGVAAGYASGESMVSNCTTRRLEFVSQEKDGDVIRTVFRHPAHGIIATQTLTWHPGEKLFEVNTTLENAGSNVLVIDMLDSFQLGMLSPFAADDAPGRYHLHRTCAFWAAEGRQIDDTIEHLNLERAWTPAIYRAERFGQRSSMPVKRWFPWAGFEDRGVGVTWGVQLATYGPWQLELNRLGDYINLAGGLPDAEFGNWSRKLAPGEKISGIPALLTVVKGDAQDALNRLTQWPQHHHVGYSRNEADFPAVFNEYCKTWCAPTEEKMLKLVEALKGRSIKYFVMDDGWYREDESKYKGKGDWQTSPTRFPHGMKAYCDKIRAMGFIPGIWFEFEQLTPHNTHLGEDHPEFAVRCHGVPHADYWDTQALDFRKAEVRAMMHERVTDFLRENGIGYIKVDYNSALTGADTPNGSTMEGLMEYFRGVEQFFTEMKQRLPDLTLEICASGGHRLTPAWMHLGDMASFSDAHEDPIIPLVAAGTVLQIPYRANQVWAVLHDWDDDARICYSLSAAMIGRLCISGDIDLLSDAQKKRMDEALAFYHQLKPLIADGISRTELHLKDESWRHARGWQLFRRSNADAQLLVIHTFGECENEVSITVPENMHIAASFSDDTAKTALKDGTLTITNLHDWSGMAILLRINGN